MNSVAASGGSRVHVRGHLAPRRGTIFNYYMMYLLLTGIMVSTAGISLHIVLRSSVVDNTATQQLQTLVRMERRVRRDQNDARQIVIRDDTLVFLNEGDQSIEWSATDNIVQRTKAGEGETIARDRFVLLKGHRVQFLQSSEGVATIRVTEPVAKYSRPQADTAESPTPADERGSRSQLSQIAFVDILINLRAPEGETVE